MEFTDNINLVDAKSRFNQIKSVIFGFHPNMEHFYLSYNTKLETIDLRSNPLTIETTQYLDTLADDVEVLYTIETGF